MTMKSANHKRKENAGHINIMILYLKAGRIWLPDLRQDELLDGLWTILRALRVGNS